jgi:hypothetical protein
MDNHRSKTAKIRGFYLAHNTLLGLNELTYSRPITHCYQFHSNITTYVALPKAKEVVAILGMNLMRNLINTMDQ